MIRTHWGQHLNCYGCKLSSIQFNAQTSFQPHFNWAVGSHVNTRREFEDKMKECSDRASQSLGIDHDFQPRYDLGKEPPHREADDVLNTAARITSESSS